MPAKTILTVLFLISLGVVVLLGLHALPRVNSDITGAKNEILVATMALAPGTLLRAKDVAWQPVSGSPDPDLILRPPSAAGNANPEVDQQVRAEVYGAALRAGITAGDAIRRSAIVQPGGRDFLQIVPPPPRARAIAIPVATGGASTSLLHPGDCVD